MLCPYPPALLASFLKSRKFPLFYPSSWVSSFFTHLHLSETLQHIFKSLLVSLKSELSVGSYSAMLSFTCGHAWSSMSLPSLQTFKPLVGARELCARWCSPSTHPTCVWSTSLSCSVTGRAKALHTTCLWRFVCSFCSLQLRWQSVWGGRWQERIIFITILNKSGGISSE